MSHVSGLDMGPTIDWYAANLEVLIKHLPVPSDRDDAILEESGITVKREPGIECLLSDEDIAALVALFPSSARARWNVSTIEIKPPLWFRKGSTGTDISVTKHVSEAISPTAIVPSFVGNNVNEGLAYFERYGYTAEIILYTMDPKVVPLPLQRFILAQGLVHELAHGFVSVDIYNKRDERLILLDCTSINGHEYLMDARELFETAPPISHYASTYFQEGTVPDVKFQRPLNENVVETLTAILLGFAFQLDGNGLDPFMDGRRTLRGYLEPYLHAMADSS